MDIGFWWTKTGRIAACVCAVTCLCVLLVCGVLLILSPGRVRPFLGVDGRKLRGSISEKCWITVNGVRQGMFIRGRNSANPVLLFVHGGPGCPMYALTEAYPTGLEDRFTVCWWEQRGSGLSYSPGIPGSSMTVEQLVADTIAVTNYLRNRFGQERIYLMGHSWGSFIAIQAAYRAPELYRAYIGVGQIVRQPESERLAYGYMLAWYRKAGDDRMVRRLARTPPLPGSAMPEAYLRIRDRAMHGAGIGTMHAMKSIVTGIVFPILACRAYTLGEKIDYVRGMRFSASSGLRAAEYRADLARTVPELKIPVYFFSGIYDYTVAWPLSRAYLEGLRAPVKGFYLFGKSAHSPIFEEPDQVNRVIGEDVLTGTNGHAEAH